MGELSASILSAQLSKKKIILSKKREIWFQYYSKLKHNNHKLFCLPKPFGNNIYPHIFYIVMKNKKLRDLLIEYTKPFFDIITHYEPLHLSLAGKKYGISPRPLKVTENVSRNILRLPMFVDLKKKKLIL